MTGYLTKAIGEIAKVKGGKRLPKGMGVQDEVTEHPYLRVVDFGPDGLDRGDIKYISNDTFEYVKRYTITSNDVYVSIAGTIGRVGIVPEDLSGSNLTENAAKITDISDKVDKRYLLAFLRSAAGQGALQNKAGGTSQPKLALFRIEEIEFPCPPLTVQKAVAEILTAYDDLIENNRRRMALLEEAARQLYREWFVRLRFPGHEHTRILDGVPEGWQKTTLGEIAHANQESYRAGDLPEQINYIDISSVEKGRTVEKRAIAAVDAPGRARRKAKDGDTIWSNVRPNLRAYALVLDPLENDVFSTGFTVLTPKQVPFSYLYHLVTTDEFVSHLVNHTTGASYPAVRADDFERAVVMLPPRVLVDEFHQTAEPNHRLTSNLYQQDSKLRAARDLLLPRLMSGEIAV